MKGRQLEVVVILKETGNLGGILIRAYSYLRVIRLELRFSILPTIFCS